MQESRYGYTNLIYPFNSPIGYNFNYTGTYSKYSIIDKFYSNSLVKPVKRLYYGGAEWSNTNPIALTFSLTNLAYTFADEIIFKTASMPAVSVSVSHPSYDRIDAIVINEDGIVKIKEGTPAPIPKKPVLAEDEVLIQYALIKNSVDKIGTLEKVYENNGQWATSAYQISGTLDPLDVNFQSNLNQYNATYCIAATTDYRTGLNFTKSVGTIKRSDYSSLSMRVRFNTDLDHNRFLSAQIYGTSSNYVGTASSNTINLMAYGLEPNVIGVWQHVVVPTIKFGTKVETIKGLKVRMIGGASASKASWDLDYVLFQTGVDYDEYMDPSNGTYVTSTSTGTSGGGSFSLTIEDYLTGEQFTDINKIIFRGNTVVVNHALGLTAMGVTVTGQTPEVVVWIPAPNYVAYFNPNIDATGVDRYVSLSTTQSYSSIAAPGTFGTGDWNMLTDFQANSTSVGTTRKTKNNTTNLTSFEFSPFVSSSAFSCSSQVTTIKFEVFKENESTAIRTMTKTLNVATCAQTYTTDDSSLTGVSLILGAFSNDQDKFKVASLTAKVNCNTLFPNGGRFKCRITHDNGVDGVFVNNTISFFYDSDALPTSASVGSVTFDENVAVLKKFSGVAYYNSGSTFAMTASNINLLNDLTFPTTKQIDFLPNNLSMVNSGVNFLNGHADGTKSGVGVAITGWGINWNKIGLTFSRSGAINVVMNNDNSTLFPGISSVGYIPGFLPHTTNTLDASKVSSITARIFDYGNPDNTWTSSSRKTLIDTDVAGATTTVSNPVDSESNRLSFSGVLAGDGASVFDSNILLGTAPNTGELQYIFGRIIYPQHNFTTYMPYYNFTTSCNYSALAGVTNTFNMLTVAMNIAGTTTPYTTTDYRWYVTQYQKANGQSSTAGQFVIESNIQESYFHCQKGVSSVSGTEDVVIMLGFDGSGANSVPNKYLFLTGNTGTYGGRTNGPVNFLGTSGNSTISFTMGYVSAPCIKFWLFIGLKNTTVGKQVYLSDIQFTGV